MENPEADSKKGLTTNSALFFLNNTNVDISIKEHHYRLERDEEEFLKSLRDNMTSHAQMTQFLNNKAGGAEGMSRSNEGPGKSLGDLMKKKKVPTNNMNPKVLFDQALDFTDIL